MALFHAKPLHARQHRAAARHSLYSQQTKSHYSRRSWIALIIAIAVFCTPCLVVGEDRQTCYNLPNPTCGCGSSATPPEERCYPQVTALAATLQRIDTLTYTPLQMRLVWDVQYEGHGFHHGGQTPFQLNVSARVDDYGQQNVDGWSSANDLSFDVYWVCFPIARSKCYSVIVQGNSQQVKFWATACEVHYTGICECQCQSDTLRMFAPWTVGASGRLGNMVISELGPPDCESQAGDPINVTNGNIFLERDEIAVPSDLGLSFSFGQYYNSADTASSVLGRKWRHSFEYNLSRDLDGNYVLTEASGKRILFGKHNLGSGSTQWITYEPPPSIFYRFRHDSTSGVNTIILPDERRLLFQDTGAVRFVEDLSGNKISCFYTGTQLDSLKNASGRRLAFAYTSGRLHSVLGPSGNVLASYDYDPSSGLLHKVTYADESWEQYDHGTNSYDQDKLTRVTTSDGTAITYTYDSLGRGSGFRRGDETAGSEYEMVGLHWYLPADTLGCATPLDSQFCVLVYQDSASVDSFYFVRTKDRSRRRVVKRTGSDCSSCGTVFYYNSQGQKEAVTYANGSTDSMWYDFRGNLIRRTTGANSELAQTVSFSYDSTFNYPTGEAAASIAKPGDSTRTLYTYDANGNLTRLIQTGWKDPAHDFSDSVSLTYSTTGQLLRLDGPRRDIADTITYTYYPNGDLKLEILPNGDTTTFGQRDALGRSTWEREANGDTTRFTYDARGRLTGLVRFAGTSDSSMAEYSYDVAGGLSSVAYTDGRRWTGHRNGAGYLDTITDGLGACLSVEYDGQGNTTSRSIHAANNLLRYQQTARYDTHHQPLWVAGPYNDTAKFTFSPVGKVTALQDALGRTSTYQYDWLNRLVVAKQPRGEDSICTIFTYDLHNNITGVTNPDGFQYSFQYDDRNRLIYDSCVITGATRYGYDPSDNLVWQKNAAGDSIAYRYDALNRMTAVLYPDSQNVRYSYDGTEFPYGKGRLTQEAAPSCTTIYRYDQQGRLSQEIRRLPDDSLTYATGYQYDKNDNLTSLTYPSGLVVQYQYDLADNVTMVRCSTETGWDTLAANISYAPMGDAESWQLGNGMAIRDHFDLRYQIDSLNTGADSIVDVTFEHDAVGEITSLINGLDAPASRTFTYDDIGQLLSARSLDYPDTLVTYSFTRGGNRAKMIRSESEPDTLLYTYNSDRLTEVSNRDSLFRYTYDQLGRVIREIRQRSDIVIIEPPLESMESGESESIEPGGEEGEGPGPNLHSPDTTTFQYNCAGHLTSVHNQWVTTYQYDGGGRRIKKVKGAAETLFIPNDDGQVLSEFWNDLYVADYIYLNGRPLARITNGSISSVQYYINDHLGTPIALVNNDKTVQWRADAYPFGEVYDELTTSSQNIRFPGQWRDAETGLSYNWNRYYDPRTGRYLQPDPLGLAGGMNLYSYAAGNPVSYGDPDGQNPLLLAWAGWEFYQSALDIYELIKSLFDPCATWEERSILFGGAILGVLLPGGGYGRGAKAGLRFTKGQTHHVISKRIYEALQRHPILKGLYKYRDPRLTAEAKDLASHNGWKGWHEKLDNEIAEDIASHPNWTRADFERHLRQRYSRPDLGEKFPGGMRRKP